ncbi:hypothetical protein C8J56DRAFT_895020 [Mycena floridula]|nr:hypothetical protein C8J56DRAFT_895020 [Mycena floridula]
MQLWLSRQGGKMLILVALLMDGAVFWSQAVTAQQQRPIFVLLSLLHSFDIDWKDAEGPRNKDAGIKRRNNRLVIVRSLLCFCGPGSPALLLGQCFAYFHWAYTPTDQRVFLSHPDFPVELVIDHLRVFPYQVPSLILVALSDH